MAYFMNLLRKNMSTIISCIAKIEQKLQYVFLNTNFSTV
jgi:hypothetical protein